MSASSMPPPGSVDGAAPAGRLAALVSRFTSRTLPKAEWTHEAHLLVGLWHVHRYGEAEALARLREGIRRLNDAHGTPNTPSSGYHETITRAYVTLLADFLASGPAGRTIETRAGELLASPLAARDALLRYYSRERLFSPEARTRWLAPDGAPLGPVPDVLRPHLVAQLRALGVVPGATLIVHTAFSR
ncbi:MAG: hypothetical protein ACLGHP_03730, partial [Vicinamibacteria bacterium]